MTSHLHTDEPTAAQQEGQTASGEANPFGRQKRIVRSRLTPRRFRWMMRLYPPLLINAVRATHVNPDFRSLTVKLSKTLLNTNFNGAIFGGTITTAFDPWLGVMYWQVLNHRGFQPLVVNYALNVRFKRPATGSLWMHFFIPEADVEEAVAALGAGQKYVKSYFVDASDRPEAGSGEVVATAEVVVHMRAKLPAGIRKQVSF